MLRLVHTPPQIELEEDRKWCAVPLCVSVLLFLLWSLVEVHSQTPPAPYLTFMGEILPDHSYVDLSALGEFENVHIVCHTDLTSCCGGTGRDDRGFWYFPNGDVLPGAADNPIVLMKTLLVARLIRGTGPGDAPSGLYCCTIETVAVNGLSDPVNNYWRDTLCGSVQHWRLAHNNLYSSSYHVH